jgi:expansin (peptidoglycan-binding protein)
MCLPRSSWTKTVFFDTRKSAVAGPYLSVQRPKNCWKTYRTDTKWEFPHVTGVIGTYDDGGFDGWKF